MRKSLSLYLHIPFCNSKCHYCAFVSKVGTNEQKQEYVDTLIKEIETRGNEFSAKYNVVTIYIGGGTPSSLPLGAIRDIMGAINKAFIVSGDAEVTIEINPNTLTRDKAIEYIEAGINRFSLGLQAVQPKLLKTLGRTHTALDFMKAVETLKNVGADNISGDIMLGLPNQKEEDVKETINFMADLGLNHISAYMLSIEEGTNFDKLCNAGMLKLPSEKQSIKFYDVMKKRLEELGYHRYEFSNFARSEEEQSRHNKVYWNRGEYLGFGVSAHSYIGGFRMNNTECVNSYIKHIGGNEIPLEVKEEVTKEQAKEEFIMLALRTVGGINLDKFKDEFDEDLLEYKGDDINSLIKDGFLLLDKDNNLKATDKGFLVMNKIIEILAI